MRLFPTRLNPLDPKKGEAAISAIERYLHYMAERGDAFSTETNRRFDELAARVAELEAQRGEE